jgi:deoxyribodipyrimidine photo-lyase
MALYLDSDDQPTAVELADLALEPSSPDWAAGLRSTWRRGEAGAQAQLNMFLEDHLRGYADRRDFPEQAATSRLSPYLRFGNLSARQVWHAGLDALAHSVSYRDLEKFQSELGWREFSYHLLYHNHDMVRENLQSKFNGMPWREDADALKRWQQGRTGYPIVDAGMRELWITGWMHNRVRMVVASFLVKHLLIDWRHGESWFWDTLVDADPANNAASWQWVAGSGADAAPYFRIFNPVLQGEKFDPNGSYVKRWVPEIAHLPLSVIHRPWQFAGAIPAYPQRIVEHDQARRRALNAYERLSMTHTQ